MAWRSPVKCRLICSMGRTCECPPPAAPPLIPKTGPSDGSLITQHALYPRWLSPWLRPIVVTVLPSPYGVGFTLVTRISLPLLLDSPEDRDFHDTLAIWGPCRIRSLLARPNCFATSSMFVGSAARAMSRSLSMVTGGAIHTRYFRSESHRPNHSQWGTGTAGTRGGVRIGLS